MGGKLILECNNGVQYQMVCAFITDSKAKRVSVNPLQTPAVVRVAGLEPTVSWSQTRRDTKLR